MEAYTCLEVPLGSLKGLPSKQNKLIQCSQNPVLMSYTKSRGCHKTRFMASPEVKVQKQSNRSQARGRDRISSGGVKRNLTGCFQCLFLLLSILYIEMLVSQLGCIRPVHVCSSPIGSRCLWVAKHALLLSSNSCWTLLLLPSSGSGDGEGEVGCGTLSDPESWA